SKKLDYVKIRLFLILERKRLVNYKLQLSANTKIYLVFYVLLLESTNAEILV
ncbi:hypothetical protein BS50DRAFT_498190, partial [Corynespora cassiicola Philippines]